MELVPLNREKLSTSLNMAKIPTKKVKVQVRACQISTFSARLWQKVKVRQTLTRTFTFLVGIFAIFGELSHFSLLGGTSAILRTFLGGTSQKRHPVVWCRSLNLESQQLQRYLKRPHRVSDLSKDIMHEAQN